ncbi:MAG TPA: hypothetical protein VFU11_12940 [Solirubrobacterales bacterium]|nr:hypothetical protein [Solirubrobacterales bacterium]
MPRLPNVLRWASVYVTGRELWGEEMSEAEVRDALHRISVFDLLAYVGSLGAGLVIRPNPLSEEAQADLVAPIASGDEELIRALAAALGRKRILIHPQQTYHLARLAVLAADRREADDLHQGELMPLFRRLLFGIGDHMGTEIAGEDDVISLELRHTAVNHDEERLGQWAFYYELFTDIWPLVSGAPDAEEAFRRYTGVSIAEYLALGFAISAGLSRELAGRPVARLSIQNWLARVPIDAEKREAFLAALSGRLEDLRDSLLAEEQLRGPTTFGALAIEKRPLVREGDVLYVVDFAAFERRATHGIFHLLAEGPEAEGKGRELFTTPFGAAFQIWGERCLRRAESGNEEVRIFADEPYGPRKRRRDTPDIVLAYERNIICFELVAGALRIATLTHGDLDSFAADLERFIYKKATQLDKRIADIRAGETAEIGLSNEGIHTIWPVIVTSVPFPVRPMIMASIRKELKKRGLLQLKGTGPISIIGAEELVALEGYVASTGESALEVIRRWKSSARTGDIYLKNYLFERLGEPIPRTANSDAMFQALMRRSYRLLFDEEPSPGIGEAMFSEDPPSPPNGDPAP